MLLKRLFVVVLVVAGVAGCGGKAQHGAASRGGTDLASTGAFHPTQTRPFSVPTGLIPTKAGFVYRVAADAGHLVWLTGPEDEESIPMLLHQRDLRSAKTVTLARGADPRYGIASTPRWVVYAVGGSNTRLMATDHAGSRRVVLSANLVTPLAARGSLVAWGEQYRKQVRVVVQDMTSGRRWVAASMPPCVDGRCWRIDAVTLADDGVVFTRVASNPDASIVMRRAFGDGAVTQTPVPDDPQADLVPSSTGALYYAFGRGWYRWDFGWDRPRHTTLHSQAQLLGFEDGRWLQLAGSRCHTSLVAVRPTGGLNTLVSPSHLSALDRSERDVCMQFGSLTWTGTQLLTAWGVVPRNDDEHMLEHESQAATLGAVSIGRRGA